jgi:hypothetical protein
MPADPKPRLVVMTDIGGDPDDEQSIVRFLLYACEKKVVAKLAKSFGFRRENSRAESPGDFRYGLSPRHSGLRRALGGRRRGAIGRCGGTTRNAAA